MKLPILIGSLSLGFAMAWFVLSPSHQVDQPERDLTGMSSDPDSPQRIEGPALTTIDPRGPAPKLFKPTQTEHRGEENTDSPLGRVEQKPASPPSTSVQQSAPSPQAEVNTINPDAVEYYRRRGFLGADKSALAVLASQFELWKSVEGTDGLGFQETYSSGFDLRFEADPQGKIIGATVEIKGGGGGARLQTLEMWLTGSDHPWELFWETERPGSLAGQIPTPDGQELHYFCEMVSADAEGAINEPTRCHFLLNQPTPEQVAYSQQGDGLPLMKAKSR